MADFLPHEKKIEELALAIDHLKGQDGGRGLFQEEIETLQEELKRVKERTYGTLSPWERVSICRHLKRPHTSDYIEKLTSQFTELHGDRLFSDDPAIIGGLASIGEMRCVILGHEKGRSTEERMMRHFGMPHPEGFRKALRLMKLAEKFHLPVVTFIDTPGAYPGLQAEERGQARAIAENISQMAGLSVPIIVIIIGEGCSGGALGLAVGDMIGMLEHAYYSVISPEGCASILWEEASKNVEAARALKLNAEDMLRFQVIDTIIPEPPGGAHHNPQEIYERVKEYILEAWRCLQYIPPAVLVEQRYQKFRKIGAYRENKI